MAVSTIPPVGATVTITNGGKPVPFKDGKTVDKFDFGTKLKWTVEKIGFVTASAYHIIVDEDKGTSNKLMIVLKKKTEVNTMKYQILLAVNYIKVLTIEVPLKN